MRRIYLVRHCKATGQEPDAALTEEGVIQARKLADFFADREIELIVSSPYERAISTIRPFAGRYAKAVVTDDRLRERVLSAENLPDWQDKLEQSFIDLDARLPGGESSKEAMDRGISVVYELLDRPERNIIAVTHGNLLSLILKHFDDSFGFEEWKGMTNPDIYELRKPDDAGKVMVKRIWQSKERQ